MDHAGIRNLRDFLLQFNKISESCFLNCVNHLSDRGLSQDESGCVDMCTKKHVSVNHKVMQVYLELQPLILNKRIEEMNQQQAALDKAQKKELESAAGSVTTKVSDKSEINNLINVNPNELVDKNVLRTECQ